MPKLSEDIYSRFYNKKTGVHRDFIKFGSNGEEVKIISDHDNILIVENIKGERYPVKKEKIVL